MMLGGLAVSKIVKQLYSDNNCDRDNNSDHVNYFTLLLILSSFIQVKKMNRRRKKNKKKGNNNNYSKYL